MSTTPRRRPAGGPYVLLAEAKPEAPEALVDRLVTVTQKLSRAINADVRQRKLSVPLTMGQFRTLSHLAGGYNSPAELADRLAVTRPTITRLIDGLERRGLVSRASAMDDRRQVRVELTESGRAVLKEFQRKSRVRIHRLLDQLSARERLELERALTALDRALLASALGRMPSPGSGRGGTR
jgi:MarR family transcriptional regulator for hemolysin